ncbi:MAG: tetratricopeptide repeat protein, partial [Pirellulales bacterium]
MNRTVPGGGTGSAGGTRRLGRVALLAALIAGVIGSALILARRGRLPPTRLVADGIEAVDRGDAAAAREIVRRLRRSGADAEATAVQARLLLAKGFAQPAIDAVAGLGGRPDLDVLRRLVEGEAAFRSGQFSAARGILGGVVEADPASVAAHRLLATLAYDTGAIPEALGHLDKVRRLAPLDPRPVRLMALIHSDYELYAEAVPFYEESLARDPDQPDREDLLTEMASCQVKVRRYDDALATLARAAGLPGQRLLEAECRLALGQTDRARAVVEGVLADRPDDATALVLRGTIRLEDGDAAGAAEALTAAVRLQPATTRHGSPWRGPWRRSAATTMPVVSRRRGRRSARCARSSRNCTRRRGMPRATPLSASGSPSWPTRSDAPTWPGCGVRRRPRSGGADSPWPEMDFGHGLPAGCGDSAGSSAVAEPEEQFPRLDRCAGGDEELGDRPVTLRVDGGLHLHRFEGEQLLAAGDRVARLDRHRDHQARHRRPHLAHVPGHCLGTPLHDLLAARLGDQA